MDTQYMLPFMLKIVIASLAAARSIKVCSNAEIPDWLRQVSLHFSPTHLECRNKPVYKCRRGRNEGSPDVLWLSQRRDGHWVAREAHRDSENPLRNGVKVFRTMHPMTDITIPGEVEWMWWDDSSDAWKDFKFIFWTTQIRSEEYD